MFALKRHRLLPSGIAYYINHQSVWQDAQTCANWADTSKLQHLQMKKQQHQQYSIQNLELYLHESLQIILVVIITSNVCLEAIKQNLL